MQKFFIGLVLLSAPLLADDPGLDEFFLDDPVATEVKLDLVAQAPKATKEYTPQESLGTSPKAEKEYYPSDPYDDNQGPFFTAEYLLWKTHSTRMPIASTDVIIPPPDPLDEPLGFSKKTYEVRFGYDSGYRAGVGYRFPYRNWDILGNWTHFRASGEKTVVPSDDETVSDIWGSIEVPYSLISSHGKQEIHLNTFDFELGKNIHFTPPFCVRPFIGFKLAWIDQSLKVDNKLPDIDVMPDDTRSHFHFDNNFRGMGLRAGCNTDWEIAKGFAILGRGAYSLLWGKLGLKHKEHYEMFPPEPPVPGPPPPPSSLDFSFHENRHIMQSVLELFAGVRWEKAYYHKKFRFRIQGGYEAQYWPSFNQLTRVFEFSQDNLNTDVAIPFTGDMGFHGWTAGVRFDF